MTANNETNITVGLTCGIIGWNIGKWKNLSTNSPNEITGPRRMTHKTTYISEVIQGY
tara:strand:- start:129 stop:299 length:171 start_codon:yes stop_codon:yes gene_type:complete